MTTPTVGPHRAVQEVDTFQGVQRRMCRVCGLPVVGFGPGLRHLGEDSPEEVADPRYADTIERVRATLVRIADLDAARARQVALALYRDGVLRQRRATP